MCLRHECREPCWKSLAWRKYSKFLPQRICMNFPFTHPPSRAPLKHMLVNFSILQSQSCSSEIWSFHNGVLGWPGDRSVRIATRYGLDGPGTEFQCGAKFSAPVQTGPGAHPASFKMGTGSFPGVKRPGRGADHPPHPAPKLKKE